MEIKALTIEEAKVKTDFTAPEELPGEPGDYIGSYTMLASTYGNRDLGGDRVHKGAFRPALARIQKENRMPKALYQHYHAEVPAVHTGIEDTAKGLVISGYFINTDQGRRLQVQMRTRAIDSASIGYYLDPTKVDETVNKNGDVERELKADSIVILPETSFVTFPMNPKARALQAKSDGFDIREFERFLKDYGFSGREAKIIISSGYKALAPRDAEQTFRDETDALVEALDKFESILKGV